MEINLTGTTNLDFVLNEKNSFDITLTKKVNGAESDWPLGLWRFLVYDGVNNQKLISEFNAINGFTVVGSLMRLQGNISITLNAGIYYYEIKCIRPDNSTLLPFVGKLNLIKRSTV